MCCVGKHGEWYHTGTSYNAADRPTRLDSTPADLGPLSEWQNGPAFLQLRETEWPINRDFATRKTDHIPHTELLKKYRSIIQADEVEKPVGIQQLIDPK